MFQMDRISAVDSLPAIGAPEGVLGPRNVEPESSAEPLALADTRPFRVELGHGPALPADEASIEQGKRRG